MDERAIAERVAKSIMAETDWDAFMEDYGDEVWDAVFSYLEEYLEDQKRLFVVESVKGHVDGYGEDLPMEIHAEFQTKSLGKVKVTQGKPLLRPISLKVPLREVYDMAMRLGNQASLPEWPDFIGRLGVLNKMNRMRPMVVDAECSVTLLVQDLKVTYEDDAAKYDAEVRREAVERSRVPCEVSFALERSSAIATAKKVNTDWVKDALSEVAADIPADEFEPWYSRAPLTMESDEWGATTE